MHVESFVVRILGTRCRDGVKVLWCRSHLVWLDSEGSIPTCACFHSENVFVTCSRCFLGGNSKRDEWWEGRPRGKCMVCQYNSIELCCSQEHQTSLFRLDIKAEESMGFRSPRKSL